MIPTIVASILIAAASGTGVALIKYCLDRNIPEQVEVNIEINEIPAIPEEKNNVGDNEQ